MMAMMMPATSMPPQPPVAKPKFQPEKWPEMTAPTPSAHRCQTLAWRTSSPVFEIGLVALLVGDAAPCFVSCRLAI